MSATDKPLLHVMFAASAARTMQHVLGSKVRFDQVMYLEDDLSVGSVETTAARRAWLEAEFGIEGASAISECSEAVLTACRCTGAIPVAWYSERDASSYAGFLWWLEQMGDVACRIIAVTDDTVGDEPGLTLGARSVASPSALSPYAMACLISTSVKLDERKRRTCRSRWQELMRENMPLRIIEKHRGLISAPITHFDDLLLTNADAAWQPLPDVISRVLAGFLDQGLVQVSDAFLLRRAQALAVAGRFEIRADNATLRACDVRLGPLSV